MIPVPGPSEVPGTELLRLEALEEEPGQVMEVTEMEEEPGPAVPVEVREMEELDLAVEVTGAPAEPPAR